MSARTVHRGRVLLVVWLVALAGCSRSALQPASAPIDQSVALSLGTITVGESVSGSVVLERDAQATRRFARSFAPKDVEAPPALEVGPGEAGRLLITWRPQASGTLDVAVLYAVSRNGPGYAHPVSLRIELTGTAVAAPMTGACTNCARDAGTPVEAGTRDAGKPAGPCPRGSSGIVCDDANPCTLDTCVAGECTRAPTMDGESCGTFDCKVGHFCGGGTCVEVDLSARSDGMACDDGDHCTEDGACRDGLCYASNEPRKPRMLDTLTTYGEGATDAATDGEVFVFADSQHERFDIALLQNGALEYQSSLRVPTAAYVDAIDERRFLIRGTDGTVQRLDANDPLHPVLTPLPHIVPKPAPLPEGSTLISTAFLEMWSVVNGVVLISTSTRYDDDADASNGAQQSFAQTSAPLDPAQGGSRAVDLPAYRTALTGDGRTLAWTLPGYGTDGAQAVGLLQLDAKGKPVLETSISATEADGMGCGYPHEIGAAGRRFATLSEEFNNGYAAICLWEVAENPADGFSLVKARNLDEHVHSCGIELDDRYLYVSCGARYNQGALGSLIKYGETVRYEQSDFAGASAGLKFANGELIARRGGYYKTSIEAGYLWTVDDMATALDVSAHFEPLTGNGHGNLNSVLVDKAAQHALVGGFASFGVVETDEDAAAAVEGTTPAIRFADWELHYPTTGELRGDLRVLRDGARVANANPMMAYHEETSAEEVIATFGSGGTLQIDLATRAFAAGLHGAIATTADHTWLVSDGLDGWTPSDGEQPSVVVSVAGLGAAPLRADASGALLTGGGPNALVVVDPLMPPDVAPVPINLNVANLYTAPNYYQYAPEYAQVVAVDGDNVLAGSSTGVELLSKSFERDRVEVTWPELDSTFPVALPVAAGGEALATYIDKAGKAWLVQLSYADGSLTQVATLQTEQRVMAAARFHDHWLLLTSAGVHLADLACWPKE